jgi:hypothetical protein
MLTGPSDGCDTLNQRIIRDWVCDSINDVFPVALIIFRVKRNSRIICPQCDSLLKSKSKKALLKVCTVTYDCQDTLHRQMAHVIT